MNNFIHECTHDIWSGFFGIDANGNQPECGQTNYLKDVEDDCLETVDGELKPWYTTNCSKCGGQIEGWEWELDE